MLEAKPADAGAPRSECCARRYASIFTIAILLMLVVPVLRTSADEVKPLHLCADPTNLPFSSSEPNQPGFYVEIGRALGHALGRPVSYDWYKSYFGKRTVRVTLLGKQCDAFIGLPLTDDFMGPSVVFSKRFSTLSYAVVTNRERGIRSLDDLTGRRVAVQFQTTPQDLLALRDDIEKMTVITPEEGMEALAEGKVDVAFIWGPIAGWLNRTRYDGRYRVQSTEGPGLSWPVAIGFAKSSKELRDQVDVALPSLERRIADLSKMYGLPGEEPIQLGQPRPATKLTGAETSVQPANVALSGAVAIPEVLSSGREIFNGTCAHCHGPDAVQSERRIDLRLLKKRYGEDTHSRFWTAAQEGRPAKGMPAWKGVFSDEQLENVYAYLMSLQTPNAQSN
ncbi:transporter substrate-binding domain-containing protein [Bradyrhizobium sp. AUGA SZCCT0177]|uniref:c-type cytochrome n=1 Tax=Bradyrhizobium sp. AUGA SZCCT0177 TaxID=2807665 RepID=UPI002011DC0C|nr:transporter substrate-binding domain-containing protein [Bradyrhizobium sp. AUGA SZCCT0177]